MIAKILPWIIFSLFGYFLIGQTFGAKLGMIDDHEIMLFLGSDGRIGLGEIPQIVASTEVGQWGKYERFRPSYYTLRVIESALWRDNATLWYVARYVMLVIFLSLSYYLLATILPAVLAYGVVFYLLTLPFWSDILTRLGPSEIYAAVGLVLFLYGFLTKRSWMWFVGYLVAVGSKENMLILFPLMLIMGMIAWWNHKLTRAELLLMIAASVYTFWIAVGIALATAKAGVDVYGTKISYTERIITLWRHKRYIIESQRLYMAVVAVLAMILTAWKQRKLSTYFWVMLATGLVVISQYIFYNNTLPTNMRYDFPGVVGLKLLNIVAFGWMINFVKQFRVGRIIQVGLVVLCLLVLGRQVTKGGYIRIRNQANGVALETAYFNKTLVTMTTKLKDNPDKPLVFVSSHYLDYEPIVSISRFLRAKGVTNNLMLSYQGQVTADDDQLAKTLESEMLKVTLEGAVIPAFAYFSANTSPRDNCYSLIMTKELTSPCQSIVDYAN